MRNPNKEDEDAGGEDEEADGEDEDAISIIQKRFSYSRCHDVFDINGEIQVLFEYIDNGSLQVTHLSSESSLADITRQILSGLFYLHRHKIAHRHIKPLKVLINSKNHVKILISEVTGISELTTHPCNYSVGKIAYMSPKRINTDLNHRKEDGYAGDIWSMGVSTLELYTGFYLLSFRGMLYAEGSRKEMDSSAVVAPPVCYRHKAIVGVVYNFKKYRGRRQLCSFLTRVTMELKWRSIVSNNDKGLFVAVSMREEESTGTEVSKGEEESAAANFQIHTVFEIKKQLKLLRNDKHRGYTPVLDELLDPANQLHGDPKEGFYIGIELPEYDPKAQRPFYGLNLWPDSDVLHVWRQTMEKYHQQALRLVNAIDDLVRGVASSGLLVILLIN
ncbi:hypothetical protein L2E82_47978 [Cichorium intybus]|uniref:Uncharacterized protein n=1 Tax=Cichorium intybus TaxID=13427 RepID=A0ACB8YX94_CICIN|nr:hypothetical protein L2E82_47978 [Cichorium intybus]